MDGLTYFVGNKEESTVDQNTPDCNIGQDTSNKSVGADCNSTIPVQGNKGPCQWARGNWDVDESWIGVVAEV